MAGIPVYCPSCGVIFQSRGFMIAPGVTGTMLMGNQETCVRCGKIARIIDGVFAVSPEDVLSLVSGPPISKTILESFAGIVERAAKNEISSDELQKQADQLDPTLGEWVSKIRAKPIGVAAIVIIMMFLKSCNFSFDAKLDVNKLFDQWTGSGTKTVYAPSSGSETKDSGERKRPGSPKASSDGPGHKDSKPANPPKID